LSAQIYTKLGASIDNFLGTYVNNVSSSIAIGITPLVIVGLTIWILMYGYAVMRQEVQDPINTFLKNVLKFAFVFGIALGGGVYQNEIVGSINSFQDGLVSLVTQPTGITSVNGNSIYEVIDGLDEKGVEVGLGMIEHGASLLPIGGYLDIIAGLLVMLANVCLLLVCGGFAIMAKVALSFVLGLGPLFIACLAFPPIEKFFDAWLGKALNYVFLIIILAFSIGLSVSIADTYMTHAMASQNAIPAPNSIAEAFAIVLLYGALLIFVYQAPHIASGLVGGVSLSGGGIAQMALGTALGRIGSGSNKNSDGPGGNSIENVGGASGNNGGSGNGSNGGGQSAPRVPAYRRASRGRYTSGK